MNAIFADYNAMTENGHVRLTCRGSEEDLHKTQLRAGDWTWLSDSEVMVGARLEMDPYYGLVGVPDWETMVHLDDENDRDPVKLTPEFQELSRKQERTPEEEARIFQILTILDVLTPAVRNGIQPGYFELRRAGSLQNMHKPELALIEIEEARRAAPDSQNILYFYLEHLRRMDLDRAADEAEIEANKDGAGAKVLAACINVWASLAEDASDEQFPAMARLILKWADRFDQASDRTNVNGADLALVNFNRGMILLRLGHFDDARRSLEFTYRIDPAEDIYREAVQLQSYDEHARELVERRSKRTNRPVPVAA